MSGQGSVDYTFCEGEYLYGVPVPGIAEFSNSFSSLALTALGLIGIFMHVVIRPTTHVRADYLSDMVYGLMAIGGIGSAGYHATFTVAWGILDSVPMVLISTILSMMQFEKALLVRKRRQPDKITLWKVLSALNRLLSVSYLTVAIVFASDPDPTIFRFLFTLPLLVSLVLVIIGNCSLYTRDKYNGVPWKLGWYAVLLLVISFILWAIDNFACTRVIAYMRLHTIWHIGTAYASFNITTYTHFLYAEEFDCTPVIKCFPSENFVIFSVVYWEPNKSTGNNTANPVPLSPVPASP